MAITDSKDFIPELWSQAIVDEFKKIIVFNTKPPRSYGERLLRAAAKGEDWRDVEK